MKCVLPFLKLHSFKGPDEVVLAHYLFFDSFSVLDVQDLGCTILERDCPSLVSWDLDSKRIPREGNSYLQTVNMEHTLPTLLPGCHTLRGGGPGAGGPLSSSFQGQYQRVKYIASVPQTLLGLFTVPSTIQLGWPSETIMKILSPPIPCSSHLMLLLSSWFSLSSNCNFTPVPPGLATNILSLIKIKAGGVQGMNIWEYDLKVFTGQNLNRAYKLYKTRGKKLVKKVHLRFKRGQGNTNRD